MKAVRGFAVGLLALIGSAGALFGGCGSDTSTFDPNAGGGDSGAGDVTTGAFDDASRPEGSTAGCTNLQCWQVKCTGDEVTTTLTGTVYDPAGKNPLYNAIVYVPNAPLAPVPDGLSCDQCGVLASGSPIAVAATAADGTFKLENVPAGIEFPLVIQLGKWRREVKLPKVAPCQVTAIPGNHITRLPRNQSEGNLPRMAIATGGADPFECLLRKIGIDDIEFTLPTGNGRVHMYKAVEGVDVDEGDAGADAGTPDAANLWGDGARLQSYDITMLPCEGGEHVDTKTDAGRDEVLKYVNAGGRVFVTHYAYTWLEDSPTPLPSVANWEHNETDRSDSNGANEILIANLDTNFPKGKAFADWLQNVGGSADAGYGNLPIEEWRHDVESVNTATSLRWIHADTRTAWPAPLAPSGARDVTQHFTFNTPINPPLDDAGQPVQCGKVVFSDFHVSAAQRVPGKFPSSCKNDPMSPQEKALEFMLFDLSSCIQKDDIAPQIPIPR